MGLEIREKHYTVKELAEAWGVSSWWVREHFRGEPGVVRLGARGPDGAGRKGHRRGYSLWRIPASVAERVYRRSMEPGKGAGV